MQIIEKLLPKLADFFKVEPTEIHLEKQQGSQLVADATDKYHVNLNAKPKAFLIISPNNNPNAVERANNKAIRFAQIVGTQLACNIALPDFVGMCDGLSYGIFPHFETFTALPILKIFVRRRIAFQLINWLKAVATKTAYTTDAVELEQSFILPLQNFLSAPQIPEKYLQIAAQALRAIKEERWKPKFVAAHNDLWSGNVMYSDKHGFVIIDWDSSLIQGYAFYDIVRASGSYTVNRYAARRILKQYCQAIGCSAEEARYYLISAFAYLYQNLGTWPYARFLETLHGGMDYLIRYSDNSLKTKIFD